MPDELTALFARLYLDQDNRSDFEDLHKEYLALDRSHGGIIVAAQRRDLTQTRDRILDLLSRFDREQFCNQLFFA